MNTKRIGNFGRRVARQEVARKKASSQFGSTEDVSTLGEEELRIRSQLLAIEIYEEELLRFYS